MSQQKRAIITTLAVLVVISVIVAVAMTNNRGTADESANTTSSQSTTDTDSTTTDTQTAASYKDGTYTAEGGYNTPGGSEELNVTVTLKDGVIIETSAKGSGGSRDSQEYQERFISNYKSQVVGKSIDDIDLSRVSGSSLTPIGFNNAIEQIKNQAS